MSEVDVFIHPTAIVDVGAEVCKGTKIWHFCHVCGGAKIGPNVSLGQNCYVAPTAMIGSGCRIQNNVSIYDGVVLTRDVFVGPSAVFTNVLTPRAHVSRKDEYKQTLVKQGASIGANATIVCGVTIGQFAMIGAGSLICKDVPDYARMVGNPARFIGWSCQCGGNLEHTSSSTLTCPLCSLCYHTSDSDPARLTLSQDPLS